jgi:hypothetical protein
VRLVLRPVDAAGRRDGRAHAGLGGQLHGLGVGHGMADLGKKLRRSEGHGVAFRKVK